MAPPNSPNPLSTLTFRVDGMDCASCAGTIDKALSRLSGVSALTVSVARETMTLTLDEAATPRARIEDTVRKLGFAPSLVGAKTGPKAANSDARHDAHGHTHGPGCAHESHPHADADHHARDHVHGPYCNHDARENHGQDGDDGLLEGDKAGQRLAFRVEGMDCASCASTIATALARQPGVSGLVVSVARERMTLALDDTRTSVGTIEETVRKLGFKPTLLGGPEVASTAPVSVLDESHVHGPDCAHEHHGHATAAPVSKPMSPTAVAAAGTTPWWKGAKVRHAAFGAVLVAAAFVADQLVPGSGRYAFIAATLVMLAPIARRAIAAARLGAPFTIQMLLTLAATGALFIDEGEEAAIVVLFFSIGEVLEGLAAAKARSGIKALGSLLPRTAMIEEAGILREVPADTLAIGQVVVCRPGDRIPADGVVLSGLSSVDESPMTGESVPVAKEPGGRVFAGSINHDASLRLRVDRAPSDNTIARIIALVEEAQDAKAPTERFIDRFSRVYMPVIVALSVLVAVIPPLAGLGTWDTWIYRGLALLLIGCPCALVISVPAAIASSLSAGARQGMLLKGGAVIETLARTEAIAFDKTGTLTLGKPAVTDVLAISGDASALIATAAAIERESSHPLAAAIAGHAVSMGVETMSADQVRVVPGRGMEGRVGGRAVFIGAPRFAASAGSVPASLAAAIADLESDGKTVAVVMIDGAAAGLIAMRDEPRADAAGGIRDLKALGIQALMLTGDNARTGQAIGGQLGIEVRAEMLPEGKVAAIRSLAEGRTVVMVGDGINDAPALAAASIGVAMGSGTDVAMEAADAALMRNKVADVAGMIRLSRATMGNIWQNVAIALGLKAVFLVTTITGVSGLWIAVFADTGATMLVTANAMRLLGFRSGSGTKAGPAP